MSLMPRPLNKYLGFASCLLMAAFSFQSVAKDPVALKPGNYVLANWQCSDPPNAAILPFDGKSFGDMHGEDCRTTVVGQQGKTLDVSIACSIPDTAGASRVSAAMEVQLESDTAFKTTSKDHHVLPGGPLSYRLCPALKL